MVIWHLDNRCVIMLGHREYQDTLVDKGVRIGGPTQIT